MRNAILPITLAAVVLAGAASIGAQQKPDPKPTNPANPSAAPTPTGAPAPNPAQNFEEWKDDFDGTTLDTTKWERFTFAGGSGGKVALKDGELQMRGAGESRSGVRSLQEFKSDRFIFEATITKVGPPFTDTNSRVGTAVLTVMFDTSGAQRIEWLLNSDGGFEAWYVHDFQGERLDKRNLATKFAKPTLGIVRRGDEVMFMLNGEVGLQKTIKNLPKNFHVMLYGFGSSENDWDSVRVVTPKS